MLWVVLWIEHLGKAVDVLVVGCVLVEVPYVLNYFSHLVDCVVSSLWSGTMAGHTVHVNPYLHSSTVTAVDAAVGRLCGDDELDLLCSVLWSVEILVHDGLPAHAVAVLFLDGSNDHDLIAFWNEAHVLHYLCTVCCGSHSTFLVGSATAVDLGLALPALVWVCGPVVDVSNANGVYMGVYSDDLVASSHPTNDVSKLVDLNLVVSKLLHLFLDSIDNTLLFAALRWNCNHVSEKLCH